MDLFLTLQLPRVAFTCFLQGSAGSNGKDGKDGKNGFDGPPGPSVSLF